MQVEYRWSDEESFRAWCVEQAGGDAARAREIAEYVRPPQSIAEQLARFQRNADER